eukprot:9490579-Pyramimonas_sp.AAC.1
MTCPRPPPSKRPCRNPCSPAAPGAAILSHTMVTLPGGGTARRASAEAAVAYRPEGAVVPMTG